MDQPAEKNLSILLAEDDVEDYLLFTRALAQTSHNATIMRAENGVALMDILSRSIPDLLFLDLKMPCKDGRQCISEIRSNALFDKLPVIVYTTLSDLATIDHFYKAGTNFFAVKPSSIIDLKIMLQTILDINWRESIYYPPKDKFVFRQNKRN